MFGYSLIRTKKLMAIYDKIAIFAVNKLKQQKTRQHDHNRNNHRRVARDQRDI